MEPNNGRAHAEGGSDWHNHWRSKECLEPCQRHRPSSCPMVPRDWQDDTFKGVSKWQKSYKPHRRSSRAGCWRCGRTWKRTTEETERGQPHPSSATTSMATASTSGQSSFGLGRKKKNPGLMDQISTFFGGDKKKRSKVNSIVSLLLDFLKALSSKSGFSCDSRTPIWYMNCQRSSVDAMPESHLENVRHTFFSFTSLISRIFTGFYQVWSIFWPADGHRTKKS